MRTRNDDSLGWVGGCFRARAPWRGLFAPGRGNIPFWSPKGVRGALTQVALGVVFLLSRGLICNSAWSDATPEHSRFLEASVRLRAEAPLWVDAGTVPVQWLGQGE